MVEDRIKLTETQARTRRSRSIAIGLSLAGFVLLFYVITLVKFGSAILDRPM